LHSAALSLVATSRSLDDHAASKRPSLAGPASGRGLAPPVIMTPAAGPTGRDPAGPSCSPAGGGPAPRPFAGHCQPECRGRRRARPPREGGCQFLRCSPLAIGTPALILSHAPRGFQQASLKTGVRVRSRPPSRAVFGRCGSFNLPCDFPQTLRDNRDSLLVASGTCFSPNRVTALPTAGALPPRP
jgi:hypothetical protein